jgi:hypothetical protein
MQGGAVPRKRGQPYQEMREERRTVRSLFGPIKCQSRRDGWRRQSGVQRIFLFGRTDRRRSTRDTRSPIPFAFRRDTARDSDVRQDTAVSKGRLELRAASKRK